jgi:Fe(3+) dicitrate transport protein
VRAASRAALATVLGVVVLGVVVLACPSRARADDDVVVRGSNADDLERSTGSGSQVSRTEIARAQPQTTTEILRRVPGLNVRQEDGMGLRLNLGVRGLNPSRSRLRSSTSAITSRRTRSR